MIETISYFLTIIVLAFFTGLVVKTADYFEDTHKKQKNPVLILIGLVYGLLIFIMAYYFPIVAPIWLGTVLGLILFGKIDKISHRVATALAILLTLTFFLEAINILLLFFVFINIAEELVNDYFDKHKLKNIKLQSILSSRPLLEVSAFLISLILNRWEIFLAIFFFDIAYLLITKYENKKINENQIKINKIKK
ncbi:MAG: hypothetical protein WC915_03795 [archaeon]|jgi:hypothetical protein